MPETLSLIAAARAAALERRFDEAARLAARVLARLPGCLVALRTLAWSQLELAQDEALGSFERCALIDPEDALAHVGQAIWHQQRQRTVEATHSWTRAWELDPHNQSIRRALVKLTGELPDSALADAVSLVRAGGLDEALEPLRALVQAGDGAASLLLMSALSRTGAQREALRLAASYFANNPHSVKATLYVAAVEDRAGRTLRSRELLVRAEHADPGLVLFADSVREVGLQPALDQHRASRPLPAAAR